MMRAPDDTVALTRELGIDVYVHSGGFGTRVRARFSVPERSEMAARRSTTDTGGRKRHRSV
jgi:hypothetical protein